MKAFGLTRQRPRIDDCRYRVRSVVKSVDELEAERDQKRDKHQREGRVARDLCAGTAGAGIDAIRGKKHNSGAAAAKEDASQTIDAATEIRSLTGCGLDRAG